MNDKLRNQVNKQLVHLSYSRDANVSEITNDEQKRLYAELKRTWRAFRRQLPSVFAAEFNRRN